jgi:hypothetical protein
MTFNTRRMPATKRFGKRMRADEMSRTLWVPYDESMTLDENHKKAAADFAEHFGLRICASNKLANGDMAHTYTVAAPE